MAPPPAAALLGGAARHDEAHRRAGRCLGGVAAAGFWLMTFPLATVVLACRVTLPTLKPAAVRAVVAADSSGPITFGTATGGGRLERTRSTLAPGFTTAPPGSGF